MENKCLITKLKSTVNNDSLLKIDEMLIGPFSNVCQIVIQSDGAEQYIIDLDGEFVNSQGTSIGNTISTIGGTGGDVFIPIGHTVKLTNKYHTYDFRCIDFIAEKYMSKYSSLHSLVCSFDSEFPSAPQIITIDFYEINGFNLEQTLINNSHLLNVGIFGCGVTTIESLAYCRNAINIHMTSVNIQHIESYVNKRRELGDTSGSVAISWSSNVVLNDEPIGVGSGGTIVWTSDTITYTPA